MLRGGWDVEHRKAQKSRSQQIDHPGCLHFSVITSRKDTFIKGRSRFLKIAVTMGEKEGPCEVGEGVPSRRGRGMVLTPWRSDWPVTRYWPPRKVQTLAAMTARGWHRRDMMVLAGAQCAHLLGSKSHTAVQLVSGCWILVLTEERAHLDREGEGEVPVVIMGPSLRAVNHACRARAGQTPALCPRSSACEAVQAGVVPARRASE